MPELKKVFYSLPIDKDIEVIIDSAKQIDQLDEIKYSFELFEPYYQATLFKNDYFKIKPESGNIEIFISDYGLAGQDIDSLQVIYVSLRFGDELTEEIKNEYHRLLRIFESRTGRSEKYELFANSGKTSYGQNFYINNKDELPFMAIEVGLGDCTSDEKSITIYYYKKLSTT